ncbi:hypothetical protein A3B85_03010 [Candidatus Nomurabacteria bacterium RIFCSPHIGHO2_02_FULL_37_13]|uniref:Uncharacterized protein n=1 Tax=Candidatus Nomurabacteria bacterium RIFCSPHIGHO2_02_FULL_37_13 TaxID=1801750 RepID=A0A1F6W607_9BACT|nr:MAG: hypothetical protein A2640_01475 [Candidatus Nomurabacteria bacterium RIFCSPHIGHO2_01_FULL_36_23]OGI77196.1 MAG: hypothetical protein A3B85_03010 [Candidatus Nomurabacteria bacterium RIFCSPHIGHO2_02_FULL_37_13]OGI87736.1 MAG: hypothetical protein A2906_02745 [Candidatus Nomurabacteria bacterium RIFCSPLOWO2_01_FULL_37_25]
MKINQYIRQAQYKKGFASIILIGVIVLVALGGYFTLKAKQKSSPEQTSTTATDQKVYTISDTNKSTTNQLIAESKIIESLKTNWQSIQALIPFRPGHPGTVAWLSPYSVQFIGKNNLLVGFEDGYNPGVAVLNFNNDQFKILETFKNQAVFTFSDWQSLINKYGNSSYPVSTYTVSLLRNKQIVSFQDLINVPENIFLKNY